MSYTEIDYSKWSESIHSVRMAEQAITDSLAHILTPDDDYKFYYNEEIKARWQNWQEVLEHHCKLFSICWVARSFPDPPEYGEEFMPCRYMWAITIDYQVTSSPFIESRLKYAVSLILARGTFTEHHYSCPCKVPNNPWTQNDIVKILKPLGVRHNPLCECAGRFKCNQLQEAFQSSSPAVPFSTIEPPPPIDLSSPFPPTPLELLGKSYNFMWSVDNILRAGYDGLEEGILQTEEEEGSATPIDYEAVD